MKKAKKKQLKPNRRFFNNVLCFLFILILPTQFGKHFFFPFSYLSGVRIDYLAPTLYLTDIIVVLLTFVNIHHIISLIKKRSVLLMLFLLVLNVLFAQSISLAMYRYLRIVEVMIVGVIAYRSVIKEKMLLSGFLVTGSFQLLLAILQLATRHSLQGVFYFFGERYMNLSTPGIAKASLQGIELLRPYGTFSHPNSLAGFFVLLYVWILADKRFNKFLLLRYMALFVFSALVCISFSKVAILVYIILNAYYLLYRARISCRLCKWARFIILGIVGLLFMQARTDPLTIQKRFELLKNSLNVIFQHPFTGVGIGNYLMAQNQFTSKFSYFFNQPVHNIFLLGLAELGIPFGLYVLYILSPVFKKLFTTHYLLLIALFITGFFDHYWLTLQQNFLLMGFIIGASMKRRD